MMMKQSRRGFAGLSLAVVLPFAACSGRQPAAFRSAAVYDEANRKGSPVEDGHEHGGHAAGDAGAHADGLQMPATTHSATHHESMPGMQHGASTPAAPSSTTDLARIDPKATLSPDSFDAPSPVSVAEAVKAANNVPDGEIRHIVPGQDHENPPTPQPAFRGQTPSGTDHSAHGASAPTAQTEAAIYACPMHPEVTSDRPGSCPKCGMTLVKKENSR